MYICNPTELPFLHNHRWWLGGLAISGGNYNWEGDRRSSRALDEAGGGEVRWGVTSFSGFTRACLTVCFLRRTTFDFPGKKEKLLLKRRIFAKLTWVFFLVCLFLWNLGHFLFEISFFCTEHTSSIISPLPPCLPSLPSPEINFCFSGEIEAGITELRGICVYLCT